jgi:anti-anti-sigma factor
VTLESRRTGVDGSSALIELDGEISEGSFGPWADELTRIVGDALEGPNDGVTLDVGGLRFIDLEGVAILLRLAQRARSKGKNFRVRTVGGQVAKKLSETGVLGYLSG